MTAAQHKTFGLRLRAVGAADEAQLAAIRTYTLRDFSADELMVRTFVLAHNCIDRDNECFSEELLADFARTIPGKGCYIKHPGGWDGDSGPAEGRVFGARVERMSLDAAREMLREPALKLPPDRTEVALLITDVFFARTADNSTLLTKMDAGIAGDVSIGFTAAGRDKLVDSEGRELSAYRWRAPGEAMEQSLIWLGAQPGARAIKTARPTEPAEDTTMDAAQIKALETERDDFKAKAEDGAKDTALLGALRKALGDAFAALLDTPEALVQLVTEGKAFRTGLIDDLVVAERQLGLTGDTDDDAGKAKALYADMPTDKLKALSARYEKQLTTGGKVRGTDPNAKNAGTDTVPDDSPARNVAIIG